MTRLAHKQDKYYLTLVPVEIVQFDQEKMEQLGGMATPQWPVAFTKVATPAETFLRYCPCNHIHGVYGDYIEKWKMVAKILGIEVQMLDESTEK